MPRPLSAQERGIPQANRQRVVIGHPYLQRGGSEARVMWLIEALKRDHAVTVMTTGGWDLKGLNAYYGTHVQPGEVKVRIAPIPFWAGNQSAAALRGSCYQRFARKIAPDYDIRISAYNPLDWGMPAIHFIADFSWSQAIRERFDPPSPGFIYKNTLLRKSYLKVAHAYELPSGRDFLHNDVVIANSQWSASLMKQQYGVECTSVIYPSVWTEFPILTWADKEHSFVMIGRIAPEKRVEDAIAILADVRAQGHQVRLHLCGHIADDTYGKRIAELCRQHTAWVIPEGRVSGNRKAQILSRCRFGIQARGAEPFGISVAEMIKAGAIVFAQNNGGQTEILNHDDLLFDSHSEAVKKICAVLSDAQRQESLKSHLSRQSASFSNAKFMDESRKMILNAASPIATFAIGGRPRPRVVIGHPRMQFGGSEAAVMWMIEALKADHDVTVMTTGGWNLAQLNSFYGTQVQEHEVKVRIAPVPLVARRLSVAALRGACYQRFARNIAAEYDLRISAYNPLDWGLPAIHLIADFSWDQETRKRFDPASPGYIYRDTVLRHAYLRVVNAYSRPTGRDVLHDDVLLANSQWSADLLREHFGADCAAVVYPPVWEEFPHMPWEQKENAFVMIGRIAPEKRIEDAIAILSAVRQRGHAIQLHLCGHIDGDAYGRQIAALCEANRNWIIREGRVSGETKSRILSHCRFGIQTRGAEPFGISVAEMAKAGAIVFATAQGGQAEILQHPDLLYTNHDEAVDKISAVLTSPDRQSLLQRHLTGHSRQFTSRAFAQQINAIVTDFSSAGPQPFNSRQIKYSHA